VEIEPDGQQFLNAKAAEDARAAGGGATDDPPRPPPPTPTGGSGSRTTIVVIAMVVAVLLAGGVAFFTLTGDDEGRRELETGGGSDIDIRDRVETTTTTTQPPETTTTAAPTTVTTLAPEDPVPFPDFGQVQPGVQPGGVPVCPGGGIGTQVSKTSSTAVGNSRRLDIEGTAVNNTTAPVTIDLNLTIVHDGVNHPTPWVAPVTMSRPTLAPGETATWTFSGMLANANNANVTAIGGGFQWADPALASCPTQ
jgi:hypothetical protein